MELIKVGQRFSSYDELKDCISQFEKENLMTLYKKDSRTIDNAMKRNPWLKKARPELVYYYIKYTCLAGGKHHKKQCTDGSRRTKTYRQNCPVYIKVLLTRDKSCLEIKNLNLEHNHVVSETLFSSLPKQRKLPAEYEERVKTMLNLQVNRKLLKKQIFKDTGKNITSKDLANIAAKGKLSAELEENAGNKIASQPLLIQNVDLTPSFSNQTSNVYQGAEIIPSVGQNFMVTHQGTRTHENVNTPPRAPKNPTTKNIKTSKVKGLKKKMIAVPKPKPNLLVEEEKRKLEDEEEKLRIKKMRMENKLAQTELLREQVNLLKQLLYK